MTHLPGCPAELDDHLTCCGPGALEFTRKYTFVVISTIIRGLPPVLQVLITLVSPYLPPFYFYLRHCILTAGVCQALPKIFSADFRHSILTESTGAPGVRNCPKHKSPEFPIYTGVWEFEEIDQSSTRAPGSHYTNSELSTKSG